MKNKQFWIKVVVWILAILMIGSCVTVALTSLFAVHTHAAEATPEVEYVTAGLMYGSDVTVGFETVSTVGFTVYAATATKTERSLEEIYTINLPKISVVCDDNLSQSAYTYSIYNTSQKCVIGGHHLEVKQDFATREEAEAMLAKVREGIKNESAGMNSFLAYIHGKYKVRISDCSSTERAAGRKEKIPKLSSEIEMVTASPTATSLSVVNPETNTILFEFDDGGNRSLALSALPKDGVKQYLKTPANRLYDGYFLYKHYKTSSVNGVALTNMLPLEDYIAGVVPYEISPNWPYEALRAFAITVRGYTVKNMYRHYSAYGFDICNTTHCQVYRGIGSANEAVYNAVASTAGLVLSDGETIVSTYYSSSTGGYTVSAKDTWGGSDSPYLQPTYTPWERYSTHNKGLWLSEVSGTELAEYLRSKGYDKITGKSIVDVTINEYAAGSPYVYSISYIDSNGNKLTVTRCDKVRTSVSKYVNSANFVVGKGTLTYSYDTVMEIDMDSPFSFTTGNYSALGETRKVLSATGITESTADKLHVQTADGVYHESVGSLYVAAGENCYHADAFSQPGVILQRKTVTHVAADENTFIFAGKGWGHGVGISQYGTLDLAEAGATAEEILSLYFPALSLYDYHTLQ